MSSEEPTGLELRATDREGKSESMLDERIVVFGLFMNLLTIRNYVE